MVKGSKWLPLLKSFVKDLRISSKEVTGQDERGVRLDLWGSQKRFLEEMAYGLDDGIRWFIVCKARQLGITTISLAIDVFWPAMHPHLPGVIVSDTDKNRRKNRAAIERYVASLPDGYFGDSFYIKKANDQFILFSNGSKLDLLVAGTKASGTLSWAEGEGYAYCHSTETAAYGNAAGLSSLEESFAQKNPARLFLYESTPKGFNHFRDRWLEAERDKLTKKAIFIGWWASEMNRIERSDPRFPEYDYPPSGAERDLVLAVQHHYGVTLEPEQLAWIRYRDSDQTSGDPNLINQNQPWVAEHAFITSGHSFFQTRQIAKDMRDLEAAAYPMIPYRYDLTNEFFAMKLVQMDLDLEPRDRIELKVWEEPVEDGRYVIGCDPAYGRNAHKDSHCASVWRCYSDRMVQVAEWATADVEAKHCAWVLAHLAGAYKNCIVNLEIGGPGRMIMLEWEHIKALIAAEYSSVPRDPQWEDALNQARWYLYRRPDTMGAGFCFNFETSWRTKAEIMHGLRGAYMTRELDIRSFRLLDEMTVVVQDGDTIGAPESKSEACKDDRVFAAALAWRAWTNWMRAPMLAEGLTYAVVTEKESSDSGSKAHQLNDIVRRFFKTAEERAAELEAAPPKTWKEAMGLQ